MTQSADRQVDTPHYHFRSYETPERFTSYYHQVSATLHLRPKTVLEIGVGGGTFRSLMTGMGVNIYSMDIDINLQPSLCGNVLSIPLKDDSVDVCVAFQVLEHLPFEHFAPALRELTRVARFGVVISLPEFSNVGLVLSLPFIRKIKLRFSGFPLFKPRHRFDGQHYWEINKRGYNLNRILDQIREAGLGCERTWLNHYNPYHRFFSLRKPTSAAIQTPRSTSTSSAGL